MSQEKAQLIAPLGNMTVPGVTATGVITATSFDGNATTASGLSNTASVNSTGIATFATGNYTGNVTVGGNVDVTGNMSVTGTLTYEAADQVVKSGYGISTAIGVGGDPIIGTTLLDTIKLFMDDPETDIIVLIGEIGGQLEIEAAYWVKSNGNKKPVVGFIAGQTAPPGRRLGQAGAIISGGKGSATNKMTALRNAGIHVCASPAEIGKTMATILKEKITTLNKE